MSEPEKYCRVAISHEVMRKVFKIPETAKIHRVYEVPWEKGHFYMEFSGVGRAVPEGAIPQTAWCVATEHYTGTTYEWEFGDA